MIRASLKEKIMVNGKAKGSGFEREVCKALSKWVSKGKRQDIFWRSAMSGGRATVQHAKGISIRQAGDICAVAPEGHVLTDRWFLECKHVKNLAIQSFLLYGTGALANFWKVAQQQARQHRKSPMIIARQNHLPIIVVTYIGRLELYTSPQFTSHRQNCD